MLSPQYAIELSGEERQALEYLRHGVVDLFAASTARRDAHRRICARDTKGAIID
jgi:hypothetical protein